MSQCTLVNRDEFEDLRAEVRRLSTGQGGLAGQIQDMAFAINKQTKLHGGAREKMIANRAKAQIAERQREAEMKSL